MLFIAALLAITSFGQLSVGYAEDVDYQKQVAPILQKYCVGCHNTDDFAGELDLATFAAMQEGGEHGPAIVAGKASDSLLIRAIVGDYDSVMPPEGSEAPSEQEVALLKAWIDAGAKGPVGGMETITLNVPKIQPQHSYEDPITSIDWSDDGKWVAVASFQHVDILDAATLKPV
ncbi:MAG: hypothetical protein CMJ46_06105, partial [Planctomyces sp.]|nr:hypothetical protein [Planctomyces sp.]